MLLVTRNTRDFDGTSPSVRVPYSLQRRQIDRLKWRRPPPNSPTVKSGRAHRSRERAAASKAAPTW